MGRNDELQAILDTLERPSRVSELPQRAALARRGLALLSRTDRPDLWAHLHIVLANALLQNPVGRERADNVEGAIEHYKLALEMNPSASEPLLWARLTASLGAAYLQRIRGNKRDNLEHAKELFEKALEVITRERSPIEWAGITTNLATAYQERISGDRGENLALAIEYYTQALRARGREDHPFEWAFNQNNLGNTYMRRGGAGRAEDIECAIKAFEQALQVITRQVNVIEWARIQMNLGNAHSNRVRGDRATSHELAIQAYENALELLTRDSVPMLWAMAQMNLGNTYEKRVKGERAENCEKAIECFEQALQWFTRDRVPIEWAQAQLNMGVAYMARIRGDRAENVERAIECYKRALEVRTRESLPIEWALTQSNLGNAYQRRVTHERADNLEKAIHAYEQALTVLTREKRPLDWATVKMNLGTAYEDRIYGDGTANLERALEQYRDALLVRTREALPHEWARVQMNLGNAHCKRRLAGVPTENIEESIKAYERALEVMTPEDLPTEWATVQMNLGNAYESRTEGSRGKNLDLAVQAYRRSLEVRTLLGMPADHQRAQRNLSLLAFEQQQWEMAVSATQGEVDAHEVQYRTAPTAEARRSLLRGVEGASVRLAFALAKLGRSEQAIIALEQGRARLLAEVLSLDQAPLDVARAEDRRAFESAREEIVQSQGNARTAETGLSFVTLSGALASAYERLNTAIRKIQEYAPGFFSEARAEVIGKAAAGAPLVFVAATSAGGFAMVARATGIASPIWLPELTSAALADQMKSYLSAPGSDSAINIGAIESVQTWLWTAVMEPIIKALDGVDEIVLIPGGHLNLLPLHAARTQTGSWCALDVIGIRYAPSAAAALAAMRAADRAETGGILAIEEPAPVDAGPLPSAAAEVAAALRHFRPDQHKRLASEKATHEVVSAELPRYSVLHFCCHGKTDMENPLESGLVLSHGRRLTLQDFLSAKLPNARLAVLSACETGIPDKKLPDEVVSIPSALLQAGVSGIVASLWKIPDESTAMLMQQFYQYWREDHLKPSQSLRRAQLWVRDQGKGHAYYWGAFYYTGA